MIDNASAFKRDFKREKLSGKHKNYAEIISEVLKLLLEDMPLPERYSDHELIGDWLGYRECHIKPDLLLIYRKSDANTLRLARLGSHSELFG